MMTYRQYKKLYQKYFDDPNVYPPIQTQNNKKNNNTYSHRCPECGSLEHTVDCYDAVIFCNKCGAVLTATHQYVGSNTKIDLPWGFRASLRQCEIEDENDYSNR